MKIKLLMLFAFLIGMQFSNAAGFLENKTKAKGVMYRLPPFKDFFYLNSAQNSLEIQSKTGVYIKNLELLSIDGNIVKTSNSNRIDVSDTTHGIYILKVITDQGIFAKKIIRK